MNSNILEVKNLNLSFKTKQGYIKALNNVNINIGKKEILGVVGESGCGKSTLSDSIIRLLSGNASIEEGEINFNNKDILKMSKDDMRKIRGKHISLITQNAMAALNPVRTIEKQFVETICAHKDITKEKAKEEAEEMLYKLNISQPKLVMKQFSFQLSGGMRQRIIIALSLLLKPKLIIADEPTTALDVTVQAGILKEMKLLKKQYDTSVLFISHNLAVISNIADKIAVMYAGSIVEYGKSESVLKNPLHPYTKGLIKCMPHLYSNGSRLYTIEGQPPDLYDLPKGCAFSPRCTYAVADCFETKPEIHKLGERMAACKFIKNLKDRNETNVSKK